MTPNNTTHRLCISVSNTHSNFFTNGGVSSNEGVPKLLQQNGLATEFHSQSYKKKAH